MKEGLWKYSRHPNYFFETLVWTGISVMFIGNPGSAVSFIGPISIFIITFFITGPITEKQALKSTHRLFKITKVIPHIFFHGFQNDEFKNHLYFFNTPIANRRTFETKANLKQASTEVFNK